MAENLSGRIGADLFEISRKEPYSSLYMQSNSEIRRGARPELSEDERAEMDQTLRAVLNTQGKNAEIVVTYFAPDARKSGGAYRKAAGKIRRVDEAEDVLILEIPEGEEEITLLPVRMEDILSVHVDEN